MSDTLRERALAAIQEATRCWKMCGPPPRPPCRCEQARDAAIALVLEEAARVAEGFPARTHGNLATAPYAAAEQAADEIAAAIRALKEGGNE